MYEVAPELPVKVAVAVAVGAGIAIVAALAASLLYDRASEIAEVKSDGPGSFQVALLDALWNVTADQVAASDIIETN